MCMYARTLLVSLVVAFSAACDDEVVTMLPDRVVDNRFCILDGRPTQDVPVLDLVNAFPNLSFNRPLLLTHPPDGSDQIVVVEQTGRAWAFPNSSAVTSAQATVLLDLESDVRCCGEEGLLGLAFHPQYASNGLIFVYYTADNNPRRSVISRFHVSGGQADRRSEQIVLTINQPYSNHNGGHLAFGPDGHLYIGVGDGGSGGDPENHAQNTNDLLGTILRLDVSGSPYANPPDNPFVSGGGRGEIFAWGLRNPWRFSFDRQTGDLWVGDVGQSAWEEIDVVRLGQNYGWRRMEGAACFDPSTNCDNGNLTFPVISYSHAEGISVSGGYVYRGTKLPELSGVYLYADFGAGTVWGARWDGGPSAVAQVIVFSSANPSSFGEDEAGEVYMVDYNGSILRFARPPEQTPHGFPTTLSSTGCYSDTAGKVLSEGLLPYTVNVPLWSDGAVKRRFFGLPTDAPIGFTPTGAWELPVGTVLVKEFLVELTPGDASSRRYVETRFLIRRDQDSWEGYSYAWNDDASDGELLEGRATRDYTLSAGGTHTHAFPSRSDCLRCHTTAAGRVLGPRTLQLNGDLGGVNQLTALHELGVLTPDPGDPEALGRMPHPNGDAPLADRARATLAVNCAQCHLPGGPTPAQIDLRFATALNDMAACGQTPEQGDLGVSGAQIIKPGAATESILWLRMNRRGDSQMPPLATLMVDQAAADTVAAWINSLTACP